MNEESLIPKQDTTPQETTSRWAKKRKFFYTFLFIGIFLIFIVYLSFKLFYTPPSCFDGRQNQMEFGIDCGGPCQNLCSTQVTDIVVKWVEVFKVSDGVYSVAASIENPNRVAGIDDISYNFKLYDNEGVVVKEKSGSVFIKPRDSFIIFEPGIRMEEGVVPTSATITFEESPVWKVTQRRDVPVIVKNKKLINTKTQPRLTATLLNDSVSDMFNLDVFAVVYNSENKPVAVSSTFVDMIEKNSQKDIFFTWPLPISKLPSTGCTTPVDAMLVFDRSGSMGFENTDPPQPLTDAKKAALAFVDNMSEVDQIGLVSFATEASSPIDQTLTKDNTVVKDAINSIEILSPSKKQHTNLGDGIEKASLELLSERRNKDAKGAIVLLTDGVASRPLNPEDNNDRAYPNNYARDKAGSAWDNDISVYVIGLGDKVNEDFLKNEIASSPDNYFKASSVDELKGIYSSISKAVCREESFITDIVVHVKDTDNDI